VLRRPCFFAYLLFTELCFVILMKFTVVCEPIWNELNNAFEPMLLSLISVAFSLRDGYVTNCNMFITLVKYCIRNMFITKKRQESPVVPVLIVERLVAAPHLTLPIGWLAVPMFISIAWDYSRIGFFCSSGWIQPWGVPPVPMDYRYIENCEVSSLKPALIFDAWNRVTFPLLEKVKARSE